MNQSILNAIQVHRSNNRSYDGTNLSFAKPFKKDGTKAYYVQYMEAIDNGYSTRREIYEATRGITYFPGLSNSTFKALVNCQLIYWSYANNSYLLTNLGKDYLRCL